MLFSFLIHLLMLMPKPMDQNLKEWYDKGGHKIDQRVMTLNLDFLTSTWQWLPVVDADSLETIWKQESWKIIKIYY